MESGAGVLFPGPQARGVRERRSAHSGPGSQPGTGSRVHFPGPQPSAQRRAVPGVPEAPSRRRSRAGRMPGPPASGLFCRGGGFPRSVRDARQEFGHYPRRRRAVHRTSQSHDRGPLPFPGGPVQGGRTKSPVHRHFPRSGRGGYGAALQRPPVGGHPVPSGIHPDAGRPPASGQFPGQCRSRRPEGEADQPHSGYAGRRAGPDGRTWPPPVLRISWTDA